MNYLTSLFCVYFINVLCLHLSTLVLYLISGHYISAELQPGTACSFRLGYCRGAETKVSLPLRYHHPTFHDKQISSSAMKQHSKLQ